MKAIIFAMLLIGSSAVQAQAFDVNSVNAASRWMCEAEGRLAHGGPGGGIWQRVRAYGTDQLNAAQNALNRCSSQGLRECRVGFCGKQK